VPEIRPREIDIDAAADRIASAKCILVTTHARADGDAIGSALAIGRVIRSLGKEAIACLHEPVPPRYAFLPDAREAGVWPAPSKSGLGHCDAHRADMILIVDTCSRNQLENAAADIEAANGRKLAIDHHVTRDDIVDEILVDTSAASCSLIVTRLCDHAGWPVDADTATLLFAGLATDTGWFRHSNADAVAFATAARLISGGARASELYERLYLSDEEPRVRLMGAVMSAFELRADGRLAVIRVTREMLRRCGANSRMTEEIINETHRVGSVIASAMFVEPESPSEPVRVSLRSKRQVNVAAVAGRFGGGGHERAAGAKVVAPFEEAVQRVVEEMEKELAGTGEA